MADSQLLTIVIIAVIAGVILFRLYTVLGRRTGNERPPAEDWRYPKTAATEPGRAADALSLPKSVPAPSDRPSDPVASGLYDIGMADRSFDKEQFLKGAKTAYEMILTAFAAGDRASLKPLLSEDVFTAFEAVIKDREAKNQKATLTLVGFSDVKIVAASLKRDIADITVSFASRLLSYTSDSNGVVVEGDATAVNDVTDIWSFSRQVRAHDPNWVLVATASEAV